MKKEMESSLDQQLRTVESSLVLVVVTKAQHEFIYYNIWVLFVI